MFTLVNAILISSSYMKNLRKHKKGFTMIELILVIMLVSTTFMGIISAVISTTNYLTAIKQKVTALNLAKEGVEVMYNIRDTNWRRWGNKKDLTRLKFDPLTEDENEEGQPKDERMYPGRWIIKVKTGDSNNKYFSLINIQKTGDNYSLLKEETELQRDVSNLQNKIMEEGFLQEDYKLHFLNGKRYNNQDLENFTGEDVSVGEYRRYIAIDGLYKKNGSNEEKLNCSKASDSDTSGSCGDNTAKELRFCSIVLYTRPKFGGVQICSIMTNFEK